jgi:hypothetical protein
MSGEIAEKSMQVKIASSGQMLIIKNQNQFQK